MGGGGKVGGCLVRVQNFLNLLISVRKAYIPNLEPLEPILHAEKFLVGGWVVVVCEVDFSVKLRLKLNN